MRTKAKLICFTGIDGSGKTTLAKALVKTLNKNGVECKYVYGRLKPFILRPFIAIGRRLFLREKDMFSDYTEYSSTKRRAIEHNSFLSTLYGYILLIEYSLQIFFKVQLPLTFGKNIICDRYIYDTVITDLSVDMNYSKDRIMRLLNTLSHFFPEPDIAFLIDVPEEIAFQRKDDTPSIEYLRERRGRYLEVGAEYKMLILDGAKNLTELKNTIQNGVLNYIERME